jgi:hypothetical protein
MTDGIDRRSAPYDFSVVRRLSDRDLARYVADREHDPVDMTFIDAEWHRRQARSRLAGPDLALATVALVASTAALGFGAYTALARPDAAPALVADASGATPSPRLAYNIDEPPFPQRAAR